MTLDIREARFYIVEHGAEASQKDSAPLAFHQAFDTAIDLADGGHRIKVLYTEEASQTEITRFVNKGIATALVSGA